MVFVVFVVLLVALAVFPTVRCALLHPFSMALNICKDVFVYFRHREYNRCPSGELVVIANDKM